MVFSVVTAAVFCAASVYMFVTSKGGVTRRMAWIPLSMSATELAMCGALAMGEYLLLTLVLMACRVTVLCCCVLSAKRDAAVARNRRRRREVWRHVAYEMAAEMRMKSAEQCA